MIAETAPETQIGLGAALADGLEKRGAGPKAEIVRAVVADFGEDIPLNIAAGSTVVTLTPEGTLAKAADKLRGDRENPEALSDFLDAHWKNFAANLVRSGRSLPLSALQLTDCPYTSQDLSNFRDQPITEMGFFLPEVLADKAGLPILRAGSPEMSIYVEDEGKIDYAHNTAGWMSVENALFTPYTNTTQKEVETEFAENNRLGQTPSIFIALTGVIKELERHFINERSTSRMLGCVIRGEAASARCGGSGGCSVHLRWDPRDRGQRLGARSLGVKS